MLGPRGVNFDNDDPVPDEVDFAGDPVLEIDMAVCVFPIPSCCGMEAELILYRRISRDSSRNALRGIQATFQP
jgi:hypothetical protein